MEISKLKNILEAILLAADRTLTVVQFEALFELDEERPTRDEIRQALHEMAEDYASRGYELKQVASGFRLQVKQEYAIWVGRLWEEKPARYTRALLETMALIAYRQPITRGEIEEVRGVSVSSNIIKTLLERDWIKVLGHKDVPGKPTLYGTTKEFLDYFNLKSLDQLPTLAEIKDLDSIYPELALDEDSAEHVSDQPKEEGAEQSDDNSNGNDTGAESLADTVNAPNEGDTVEDSHVDEVVEQQVTEESATDTSVSLDESAEPQEEREKQVFNG
ncbi:MAG: SMC-Scp complex subunit ScpB [Gammaproteobacteria bacterium]